MYAVGLSYFCCDCEWPGLCFPKRAHATAVSVLSVRTETGVCVCVCAASSQTVLAGPAFFSPSTCAFEGWRPGDEGAALVPALQQPMVVRIMGADTLTVRHASAADADKDVLVLHRVTKTKVKADAGRSWHSLFE